MCSGTYVLADPLSATCRSILASLLCCSLLLSQGIAFSGLEYGNSPNSPSSQPSLLLPIRAAERGAILTCVCRTWAEDAPWVGGLPSQPSLGPAKLQRETLIAARPNQAEQSALSGTWRGSCLPCLSLWGGEAASSVLASPCPGIRGSTPEHLRNLRMSGDSLGCCMLEETSHP